MSAPLTTRDALAELADRLGFICDEWVATQVSHPVAHGVARGMAAEIRTALAAALSDQDDSLSKPSVRHWQDEHWLRFTVAPQPELGPVIGCQCGFKSNLEESSGWGDDVVEHIVAVALPEGSIRGDRMAAGYFETVDADLAATGQPVGNVGERQPRHARQATRASKP